MMIRFNWFVYSVVIGILRNRDSVTIVLREKRASASGSVDVKRWDRERMAAEGLEKGMGTQIPGGEERAECGCGLSGRFVSKGVHLPGKGVEDQWTSYRLFQLSQAVIAELKPRIWAAGIQKESKQDLLVSLLCFLKSYTALTVLQAYPFRVAINNFIKKETATRCSIHLNNEELLALWRTVR